MLTNVVVYGYDASHNPVAYLTNTFAYQANANAVSFGSTIRWTNLVLTTPGSSPVTYEPEVSQVNLTGGFNYTVADLMDMDGDGLPDRVNYDGSTSPNRYRIQKNLGLKAGGNGAFGPTNAFGPTSTGSGSVATNSNPFPNGSGYAQLNSPYGRIRDLNGDGLPDRVMDYWWAMNSVLSGSTPYVPFTNYVVQLNTGQGFFGASNWPVSTGPLATSLADSAYYYCVESGGVNVGLFDINGDSLPDRVMSGWYSQGAMTNFVVQLNTGTNFTKSRLFGPYRSQNYNATAQTGQFGWAGIETDEAHMIDINGDGLPDRLMFPMDPASPGNELHPTTYYAVEYNNGFSFESTNSSTSVPGAFDKWPGGSGLQTANGGTWADSIINLPYVGLFDLNGDGLPDRVIVDWTADTNTVTRWQVFLNNGHGFNSSPVIVNNIENQGVHGHSNTPEWWSMQGFISGYGNVSTLMDIDGDGLLDRVMAVYDNGFNNASSRSNYFLVELNTSPFPDLLTSIDNGIGGNLSVTYNPSTAYDNRVDTSNANSVSRMPYPRQVTATVTADDGINPSQTTTYGYSGGFYDGLRREFHGFAVVTNTDPTLRDTVTYFHTGGGRNYAALGEYQDTNSTSGNFAKAGMAYRTETYGNDDKLYHVTVSQVNQTSLGNGRYFPFTQLSFDCDYPGGGTPKVTATQLAYDISTFNLTNKIEYGLVTGFNPASVGSFSFADADSADTQYHNLHYAAIGSNDYILEHPDNVSLTDANNNVIQEFKYTYNSSSGTIATKLTRISAGYYATNSYGNYNSYGLAGTDTDPVGVQSTITYDSAYNTFPATTTVGSFTTTTSYDEASGQLATSTDPAGITLSNSFDAFQRPTEMDKIPVGGGAAIWMKKFNYPATLKVITSGVGTNYTETVINDGVGGVASRTYIDGFGRPIQTRTQGENGNYRVVSIAYDGRGSAFLTTWPKFESASAYTRPGSQTANWTGFDAAGRAATNRLVTASFSSGAFSSKTDLAGDSGSPLAAKTWGYVNGSDPWWIICTDEDGKVRRYQLDAFGRTNQIQEVDGSSIYTNLLKYDLADNLTNLINANGENIYWAFDNAGGMVAMADPYLGQWTYQRDFAGRLRVQTDGRGNVIKLNYKNPSTGQQDPLGRVQTKEIYSLNPTNLALIPVFTNIYVYDSSDDGSLTVYPGLLYKVTDSEGWEKNGYDPRGRPIKTVRHLNINNRNYTNSYTYNDGDKVTSVAYPNGGPVITNTYFTGGSIKQVSRGGSAYYTVSAPNIDEFGHTTNFAYGNGVTTTRGYYPVSKRLQSIASGPTGTVFSRAFTHTAGDDIASLNGTGLSATSVTYDNLHRVKTYTGLSGSYVYDAVGNISNSIEGGGSAYGYGVRRGQAVKSAFGYTYLYDLCGNMIVRRGGAATSQSLVYDAENHLTRFAQAGGNLMLVKYGYAGDGARLWKWNNQNPANLQVWIGNIYEEKGGKTLFHVYAGSQQICTFESGSPLAGASDTNKVGYYYHQDQLTSSSVLSDSAGNQTEVNAYFPFGRTQTASPQAGFKVSRQFTGQIKDDETGLYYYNARYYDPELGRFIQADTIIPDTGNPQSYNRYSYVMNNPLRYNDPSGHSWIPWWEEVKGEWALNEMVRAHSDSANYHQFMAARQKVPTASSVSAVAAAGNATAGVTDAYLTTGQELATAGMVTGVIFVKKAGSQMGEAPGLLTRLFGKKAANDGVRSFKSFDALKRALGPAGEGRVWHHIVEQRAGNVEKFGAQAIHNTENVVNVTREVNQKIANFYSSKQPAFSGNQTVREWLSTQSFEQQREFGLKILQQFISEK
ncbi:MAG: toxin TcdB middle/N-terminal domain-containing protein [Limisphaerales bacterium]